MVWGEAPLKDSGPFAYAIASHVIEHIPDPIGWLLEITEALTPDGIISLAIPDKRYTFDIKRPLTTTGELVESFLFKRKRPSIKQIFDNCRSARLISATDAWSGRTDGPLMMGDNALKLAYDQCVRQMESQDYIDSHCWIFNPWSFLDICEDLFTLGILPLEIDMIVLPKPGNFEFLVRFRRAGTNPLHTVKLARMVVQKAEDEINKSPSKLRE